MSALPRGWVSSPLGSICQPTEQREPRASEKIEYVDIASIDRGRKLIITSTSMVGAKAPSRARKVIEAGDVLVSMTRPNLNAVAMVPARLAGQFASTGFDVLRAVPGVDPRWLFGLVRDKSFIDAMIDATQGALYPAVRSSDVRGYVVPLAPPSEQKRIADKLDTLLVRIDACRERLDRLPVLIKRFRQAVLNSVISGELTRDWRRGAGLDDEWSNCTIEQVAEVGTGSTPLRSNASFFAATGTPWITSAATGQERITSAAEFVTAAGIKAHRLRRYLPGTLLVAMYGEGKTRGQVAELAIEATINQACAAVVVNEVRANRQFIKFMFQAHYLQMRELAEGGNQPNLNLSKIKEFSIPLPLRAEQDEIVRRVDRLFALAVLLERRIAQAQHAADALTPAALAKAFRGELVPQDPGDEPAHALLDRVSASFSPVPARSSLHARRAAVVNI